VSCDFELGKMSVVKSGQSVLYGANVFIQKLWEKSIKYQLSKVQFYTRLVIDNIMPESTSHGALQPQSQHVTVEWNALRP